MKKTLLVAAIILILGVLGGSGWIYWYSVTTQSVPAIVRFIPSFAPDLPRVPLTPTNGENTDPESFGIDMTLVEKDLDIPQQYAIGALETPRSILLPKDAEANVFVSGLKKIRMMAFSPDWWPAGGGILYATEQKPGRILAFPDRDGDGVADEVVIVVAGLINPHGIAFFDNALWIATETRVLRYHDFDGDLIPERFDTVINGLPGGGNHKTRTIAFDQQGRLYVSVGSGCNVCEEDARRGAVLRFNRDGSNEEIFASGTRNAVGITFGKDPWNPEEEVLWGTENGRDWLGDDLPPDEVNLFREGKNYGWPYCYADRVPDRTFKALTSAGEPISSFCAGTLAPIVKIQAHTAPLGLRFLDDEHIPEPLRGDMLVALHGSWNRSDPVGHEIIRISGLYPDGGGTPQPYISTLLDFKAKGARDWARPVDVVVGPGGTIYITDDAAGAIYRMEFIDQAPEVLEVD